MIITGGWYRPQAVLFFNLLLSTLFGASRSHAHLKITISIRLRKTHSTWSSSFWMPCYRVKFIVQRFFKYLLPTVPLSYFFSFTLSNTLLPSLLLKTVALEFLQLCFFNLLVRANLRFLTRSNFTNHTIIN